ncbi:MAG: hypothetical protein FWC92_05490 [Defluviitaleaceae bacterium]|nr:hypothetical protein [Defluviitaleaceae bacterium]
MQVQAFAKINLVLEVVSKRPDGYHELKTIMQSLALHDTISITTGAIDISQASHKHEDNFRLICSDPSLPTDDRNLVTRAAKFMIKEYGITQPITIRLDKRIPVAAGLAGGSSDCAAAILGINSLLDLNIPLQQQANLANVACNKTLGHSTASSLMEIGQNFGADVPFCLMANALLNNIGTPRTITGASNISSATAFAEGIGEKLTPLPPHPHVWIVLVCPSIPVSTAEIFNRCKAATTTSVCPDMIHAITNGDLTAIANNFKNDLTQVTIKLHPEIQVLLDEMKNYGAIGAAMSGSGPSVFGYFNNEESAKKAIIKFQNISGRAFLTYIRHKGGA